jgi:hypothetical protein
VIQSFPGKRLLGDVRLPNADVKIHGWRSVREYPTIDAWTTSPDPGKLTRAFLLRVFDDVR